MAQLACLLSTRHLGTKLLLVGAFASCQTAALHCGIFECVGDYCCDGKCCMRDKTYLDNSWYGPLFISIMVAFAFICLCGLCKRLCRSSAERQTLDPESGRQQSPGSPTNSGFPGAPIRPQQENFGEPPPYSEVTSKPFLYPAPEDQPPAYSSLMIADANAANSANSRGVTLQSAF